MRTTKVKKKATAAHGDEAGDLQDTNDKCFEAVREVEDEAVGLAVKEMAKKRLVKAKSNHVAKKPKPNGWPKQDQDGPDDGDDNGGGGDDDDGNMATMMKMMMIMGAVAQDFSLKMTMMMTTWISA